MMKTGKRILLILLTVALIVTLLAGTALAKSDDVEAADSLAIWLKDAAGNSTQIASYDLDDIESIGLTDEVYYASIDNLPAPVLTIACGVLLDDLIADIEQNYPQIEGWKSLTFTSSDLWSKKYTASAFAALSSGRYYYPALLAEGALDADGIVIAAEPEADKESVDAMLALYSAQERIGAAGVDISDVEADYAAAVSSEDNSDCFRLCMGMTAAQLSNSTRITSNFGRGICKLEFTLPAAATTVAVTGLADLSPAAPTISVDETVQLTAKVQPDKATNTTVNWRSSDSAVATVSSDGLVTGRKAGAVTVTATAADGGYSKTTTVTVTSNVIPVSSVSLNKSNASLSVGHTLSLSAILTPANASNTAVSWSSSDPDVARVDAGEVTGVTAGTAIISATSLDGNKKAACTVTVSTTQIAATSISLRSTLIMLVDEEKQLIARLEPENATNIQLYWSSSAPGVVRVDTEGRLTARACGEAIITASSEDGDLTAECRVTVEDSIIAGLDNFTLADKDIPFSDVPAIPGDWVYEGVSSVYRLGLMIGASAISFNPLGDYKVSEALMTAARLHNIYHGGDGAIEQTSVWYQGAVDYCISMGVVKADDFGGNYTRNITRAEMAYVFANALPTAELGAINSVSSLPDVKLSDAYGEDVFLLYRAGVLSGNDSRGAFYPHKQISRREVAAIVSRMALPELRRSLQLEP